MNILKHSIAGLLALAAVSTASAQTVVHITGSTAFRAATVTAIENIMGGAGSFKAAYAGTSGGELAATYVVLQGTVPGVSGTVTVKCTWTGSTGGIKTVVQNIPVQQTTAPNGWMSVLNLPASNTVIAVASPSYALDNVGVGAPFPSETNQADVTMEDSLQSSTGFTSVALTETAVGVIPFEWVANNGSPANLTNITPLQAQAVISGGAPLSQFTGVTDDVSQIVYVAGRDFDSGTRLSQLTEIGLSPFAGIQQIFAIVSGTAGANGSTVTGMKLWPAATVLNQQFAIGNSGYASGGTLADVLATPFANVVDTTTGIPAAEQLQFGPGWLIGYLGRNDAVRATRKTNIAGNTAHRLTFNGVADWSGSINTAGLPASYDDKVIQEGLYPCWEYERLAYRATYGSTSPNGKLVADKIANNIINGTASVSGITLGSMNVSKVVEGGLITHL